MSTLPSSNYAKVMDYPEDCEELYVFDFTKGYDAHFIRSKEWGIGRYNEKRSGMYVAPHYHNLRNIHMGIDIWTRAGAPVYSFADGKVAYMQDNDRDGDYGPTVVIKYHLDEGIRYALYGHLSRASLQMVSVGEQISSGQKIAQIGTEKVNGGWAPHLHFQLAVKDPEQADMPGVVAEEDHAQALKAYPDPRNVLGNIY